MIVLVVPICLVIYQERFLFSAYYFSSSCGLKNPEQIETIQDQAQRMLGEYTRAKYPQQLVRFGRLLLLLPTLRRVSANAIKEIFFKKTIGAVPIERLLSDMFQNV